MITISKEFHFSASHQLTHLTETQPDHPCARLHGHNYVVRVFISANICDANGFILDYNELRGFQKRYIDDLLDHRHLNDVLGPLMDEEYSDCRWSRAYYENPSMFTTAEALAEILHLWLTRYLVELNKPNKPFVVAVEVEETPKTCARYDNSRWEKLC